MDIALQIGSRKLTREHLASIAIVALQLFFGLLLLHAGLIKTMTGTGALYRMLATAELSSTDTNALVADVLPYLEMAIGALLLSGHLPKLAWGALALLLTLGALVMVAAWLNYDGSVPCGCAFVIGADTVATGVVRNLVLLTVVAPALWLTRFAVREK